MKYAWIFMLVAEAAAAPRRLSASSDALLPLPSGNDHHMRIFVARSSVAEKIAFQYQWAHAPRCEYRSFYAPWLHRDTVVMPTELDLIFAHLHAGDIIDVMCLEAE